MSSNKTNILLFCIIMLFADELCCRRCRSSSSRASHQQHLVQMQPVTSIVEVAPPVEPLEIADDDGVSTTWQPDPNEPRYCLCNDVSYGDMVGCDNEDVSRSSRVPYPHCCVTPSFRSRTPFILRPRQLCENNVSRIFER